MNAEISVTTPRRATLILGYGSFGHDVLERLLASAAPRGMLTWEEARAGQDAGERSLRDLALVHVPDRLTRDPGAAAGSEIWAELDRQIVALDADVSTDRLVESVSKEADRLLSATSRARRLEVLPLGLDVIVLARPDSSEALGLLDRLLIPIMDALANHASLSGSALGAESLCFLEILDFDHYWDRSDTGLAVRRATVSSVEAWQRRRAADDPAFGRVYLIDGRTSDGLRDRRHRVDETTLFLELLLFEGQRAGELQGLWQPSSLGDSVLSTFSIRSLERSKGLLQRLAAARFAVDWLTYLAAGDAVEGGERLDAALEDLRLPALEAQLDGVSLRQRLDGALEQLEQTLLEAWRQIPESPDRVAQRFRDQTRSLMDALAAEIVDRMDRVRRECLDPLRATLEDSVLDTLHHDREPACLGTVVARLETIASEAAQHGHTKDARVDETVSIEAETGATAEHAAATPATLTRLATHFLDARRRRVRPQELRIVWPMIAITAAAVATPIAARLMGEIAPPTCGAGWRQALDSAWEAVAEPALLGPLLFVIAWAVGRLWFEPIVRRAQDRADRFFVDADRGRLIGLIRAELGPEGAWGEPLRRDLEDSLEDMTMAARGALLREVRRILDRLHERRREMLWLRGELRAFLAQHGIDLTQSWHRLDREQRDATGIRSFAERAEDFEQLVRAMPPTAARFQSVQAEQRPFRQPFETYSDAFLDPLGFVDRLIQLYGSSRQVGGADPQAIAHGDEREDGPERDLLPFLEHGGVPGLAFIWRAQDGVSAVRRYCLLPSAWQRLPRIMRRLSELGIDGERILPPATGGTAYLLSLQTGASSACLLDGPAAPYTAPASGTRTRRQGLRS